MYLLEHCLLVKYLHEGTLFVIASGRELAGSRSGESAWGWGSLGGGGGAAWEGRRLVCCIAGVVIRHL